MANSKLETRNPKLPRALVLAARPKTLPAAVAPVLLGTALAVADGGFHLGAAVVAAVCAVLIQVGTNYHNDVSDFEKGADTADRKGPVRATAAGWVAPSTMRAATYGTFALAFVLGLYLVWRGGWLILAIGVASIGCGLWYTGGKRSLAYLGIAEGFVLVFFGPIAVGGTYVVQALAVSGTALIAGLGPGLLATAILIVNNLRDIDEDRLANKRTPAVRFGARAMQQAYLACIAAAAAVPVALVLTGVVPAWCLLALLVLPASVPAVRIVVGYTDPRQLNAVLARTGQLLLFYSLLFSAGLLTG